MNLRQKHSVLSLQNIFRMFNIHIRFSYEYKRSASQYDIKENLVEYVEC